MRVQEEHDRIGWAQFTAPKAHHRFLSSAFHRDKHVLLLPIGRARDRLYVCVCVCVCVFGLCVWIVCWTEARIDRAHSSYWVAAAAAAARTLTDPSVDRHGELLWGEHQPRPGRSEAERSPGKQRLIVCLLVRLLVSPLSLSLSPSSCIRKQ